MRILKRWSQERIRQALYLRFKKQSATVYVNSFHKNVTGIYSIALLCSYTAERLTLNHFLVTKPTLFGTDTAVVLETNPMPPSICLESTEPNDARMKEKVSLHVKKWLSVCVLGTTGVPQKPINF